MNFTNLLRSAVFSILVLAFAGIASAQGPVIGSTTFSELEMSANVQTAVQLNISQGTGGATVSGTDSSGLYSIDFGDINGLGLGSPVAGVTVAPDSLGALYTTPINLTPVYSGFTTETATIEIELDAADNAAMAREDDSDISASSTVIPAEVATGAVSGVAIERYVGMYVSRLEAAGPKSATLIYTVTVD